MILKSFFKNLKKDFNNKSFDGFEFNSKKIIEKIGPILAIKY